MLGDCRFAAKPDEAGVHTDNSILLVAPDTLIRHIYIKVDRLFFGWLC